MDEVAFPFPMSNSVLDLDRETEEVPQFNFDEPPNDTEIDVGSVPTMPDPTNHHITALDAIDDPQGVADMFPDFVPWSEHQHR